VRSLRGQSFPAYTSVQIPSNFEQPAGSIETCAKKPKADSRDGNYIAHCANSGADEFWVEDRLTGETVSHWKLGETRRIVGFAWSPNSRSVAFLSVSARTGKSPGDLTAAASGHPVTYETVFLNILDMSTRKLTAYEIHRDVRAAFTRILSWSE